MLQILRRIFLPQRIYIGRKRIDHGSSGKHRLTVDFRNDLIQYTLCSSCSCNFHVITVILQCSLIITQRILLGIDHHIGIRMLFQKQEKIFQCHRCVCSIYLTVLKLFLCKNFFPAAFPLPHGLLPVVPAYPHSV